MYRHVTKICSQRLTNEVDEEATREKELQAKFKELYAKKQELTGRGGH